MLEDEYVVYTVVVCPPHDHLISAMTLEMCENL